MLNLPPPTPTQARLIWFSLTALATAVLLALAGGVVWGLSWLLQELSSVLFPVALALILAYILDPVVEFFVRKKVPRLWAIVLVFVLAAIIVTGTLGSVIPGLVRETRNLVTDLPRNTETARLKLQGWIERSFPTMQLPAFLQLLSKPAAEAGQPATNTNTVNAALGNAPMRDGVSTNSPAIAANGGVGETTGSSSQTPDALLSETVMLRLAEVLQAVLKWLGAQLGKVTTWAEFLIGFVLVPVYLFYFLLEKRSITSRWTDYLPIHESRAKEEIVFVLKSINDCMVVFFRGQVLVALCVGVLLALGFLVLGLNYAVLLGFVAAVLGIVPYLGTITTLLLALVVAAIQFGDWSHPLLVLGIVAVVKLLEDFLISPKIIGDRAGLHPLTIIVAVMVGTIVLGGVLGALFAIPLTAVLRTLMFRYVWKHRPERRGAAQEAAKELAVGGG